MRTHLRLALSLLALAALTAACGGDPATDHTPKSQASLSVDPTTLPEGAVGARYQASLRVTGGRPGADGYRWSIRDGALPGGLQLQPRGMTGVIEGRPSAEGVARFEVQVEDADGAKASRALQLTVRAAPAALAIINRTLPDGVVGQPYHADLVAVGGQDARRWRVDQGALPEGLRLATDGALSGTPTAAGEATVWVAVSDGDSEARTELSITVRAAPVALRITTQRLPDGVSGQPYAATITGVGGSGHGYVWRVSAGALPSGLALKPTGLQAELSGTVAAPGSQHFSLTLEDDEGATTTAEFSVRFTAPVEPLQITTSTLPVAMVGAPYDALVEAAHGIGAHQWALIGDLPAGLSLDAGDGATAHLRGTPSADGDHRFSLEVRDADGREVRQAYTLQVRPATPSLQVLTQTLPVSGCLPYRATIRAAGGQPPYTWGSADLPAGLRLRPEADHVLLVGRPVDRAPASFTVQVRDAGGQQAAQNYTLDLSHLNDRWIATSGRIAFPNRRRLGVIDVCDPTPGAMRDASPTSDARAQLSQRSVRFLPDGARVLFIADLERRGRRDLYLVDLTTPALTPQRVNSRTLDNGDISDFEISPDGSRVAYVGDLVVQDQAEIFVADLDQPSAIPTPTRLFASPPAGGDAEPSSLSWSPDSQSLAFVGDLTTDGVDQLYVTRFSVASAAAAQAVSGIQSPDAGLEWAPLGDRLYFTALATGGSLRRLWRVANTAVLGAPVALSPATEAAGVRGTPRKAYWADSTWGVSPTGAWAFYTTGDDITSWLRLINLTTLQVINLDSPAGSPRYGSWSPDGSRLAVVGDMFTDRLRALALVDPAAPTPTLVNASGTLTGAGLINRTGSTAARLRWAPASDRVAFLAEKVLSRDALLVASVANPSAEPLDLLGAQLTGDVDAYVWSPDGTKLAGYAELHGNGATDPFLVAASGQHLIAPDVLGAYAAPPQRIVFSRNSDWLYLVVGLSSGIRSLYRLPVTDLPTLATTDPLPYQLIASGSQATRTMDAVYTPND